MNKKNSELSKLQIAAKKRTYRDFSDVDVV